MEDVYSNIGSIHGENTHSVLINTKEVCISVFFLSRTNEIERWFSHVLMLCMAAFRLFNMGFSLIFLLVFYECLLPHYSNK
jgi:hypothetical protein